jgi:hypothetical protein
VTGPMPAPTLNQIHTAVQLNDFSCQRGKRVGAPKKTDRSAVRIADSFSSDEAQKSLVSHRYLPRQI